MKQNNRDQLNYGCSNEYGHGYENGCGYEYGRGYENEGFSTRFLKVHPLRNLWKYVWNVWNLWNLWNFVKFEKCLDSLVILIFFK